MTGYDDTSADIALHASDGSLRLTVHSSGLRDLRPWPRGLRVMLSQAMDTLWFPYAGHPDGPSDAPWFRVIGNYGYRTPEASGESADPCFVIIEDYAYPTLGIAQTTVPTFQVIGSFAYTPVGSAWFLIKKERRLRVVAS